MNTGQGLPRWFRLTREIHVETWINSAAECTLDRVMAQWVLVL